MDYYRSFGNWHLRFDAAEPESRLAAGEWSGLTLADHIRRRAAATPNRVAISDDRGTLTDGEALEKGASLARGLLQLGLTPGDSLAFQLPNRCDAALINIACALAGFVVTPIIPIYRQSELRFILCDSRSKAVFVPKLYRGVDYPAMMAELRRDLPELEHVIELDGPDCGLNALIAAGRDDHRDLAGSEPDAAKLIIYTSGTTGEPKGVIYSHNQGVRSTSQSIKAWSLGEGAKVLMPSPVTHVTGFFYGLEAPFTFGTQSVLMESWNAEGAVQRIDQHQINFMVGATPFLTELVEAAQKAGSRLPSLRIFACGGASVPPELIKRANSIFARCQSFRVYGSSETPMITQGVLDDREKAANSDGRVHDWQVKVADEQGAALPFGQEGEILARGPALFRGYTKPEATAVVFDEEGYFRTGDLGVLDAEGILTITGRKKDLIIRGGENLSAKEIEDMLFNHPDLREVAVVAFPHPRLGEGVAACLVANAEARPSRDELGAWLKAQGLAKQKWPEHLEWMSELPKTPSGKVKKHELRARLSDPVVA